MKRILYGVLIVILLGACAPLATATSPFTNVSTSQPTDPPALVSATDIPLITETVSDLIVGHIDSNRIVPLILDPATNFDQALAEYKKVMNDNPQSMNWFSGSPNGKFNFQLSLDMAPEISSQVITLRYPIRVTISPTEVSAQSLNLISPIFGGGGGVTNSFPSFDLRPGTIEISPSDIFGQEMSTGQLTGILYDINSVCVQTGVFSISFQIPYDIRESGVTQSKMTTYSMVLACPQEVKVWMFNPDSDSLYGTQHLVFENGQYMEYRLELVGNPTATEVPTLPSLPSPLLESTSESNYPAQPDLITNFIYLEMEGRQGNCVNAYSPYGIRVQIKNIGFANTGPFFVDLNGILQEVSNGLLVGQSIELRFAGTIPSGQYKAIADVTNQVVESREDNNTYSFLAPTPTPPPLCVATATTIP